MKETILISLLVIHIIQVIILTTILIMDSTEEKCDKVIKTKKQATYLVMPFGFLLYVYEWYNNLD